MEVLEVKVWATPGRPAAIGGLGTVTIGPTNEAGEVLVTMMFSRKGAKRLRLGRRKRLDKRPKRPQDNGDN